jgi:folate-binding protein YgfZ
VVGTVRSEPPGDPAREVATVRAGVGVADRRSRSFTLIEGPDAGRFLQGVLSNDVTRIKVGDALYALVLTPKARIIADLRLTRIADDGFLADTEPAAAADLRATLTRYRIAARATIEPADDRFGAIAVAGPKAGMLLADCFGVQPRTDAHEGDGIAVADGVHAIASAFCGDRAFELIGPRTALRAVWDTLLEALGEYGGCVFGEAAFETLRIEAGIPRFGAELTGEVMPAEAGVVQRAISFTKGCYIGQEPVARLHYRGHANRGLRAIVLDGQPPVPGTPVEFGGREVGRVTSSAYSPTLGRTLALAIVRREVEPGRQVTVGGADGELVAAPAYARSA